MSNARPDYTALALKRQLDALNTGIYEFGIFGEESRRMQLRTWTAAQALSSIRWLKYMNAQGHHIYLRPQGSTGLVLADDIRVATLQQMENDGLPVVCAVLTSELNYQAWIRVASKPIPAALATAAGEVIATRYNADQGSKDWRHFGRAAGFCNVKPRHAQEDGRYPYVRIFSTEDKGSPPTANFGLLRDARRLLKDKAKKEAALREELKRRREKNADKKPDTSPEDYFDQAVAQLIARYGPDADRSRCDWSAAKSMMLKGYSYNDIAHAMLSNHSIQARKKGHVVHYVETMTLGKLFGGN